MQTERGTIVGAGSHGVVREVPDEHGVVVKYIKAIKSDPNGQLYFSIDSVIEPAAIRRLNCCGCPFIVEMQRCEVHEAEEEVAVYLQRLEPIHSCVSSLSKATVHRMVAQIVTAVAAMNACGVFHRDLKTVNIMRASNDDVRIIDFSLALLDAPSISVDCEPMYTLNYRAPEIMLSYAHYDREKAESWALGVSCAEIMLGMDGKNLFCGSRWYDVLSGVIFAFPTVDFDATYCFYPRWRPFIKNDMCKEGFWRYGSGTSLYGVVLSMCGSDAADFISCACDPRPQWRWTPYMLLAHPYIRDEPCCRTMIETLRQQPASRLRVPRSLAVAKPPIALHRTYLTGFSDIRERRALVEALLRFIGLDHSGKDRAAYDGAIVLTNAVCESQAGEFNSADVMRVLGTAGVFEFFSRHVYVAINDDL